MRVDVECGYRLRPLGTPLLSSRSAVAQVSAGPQNAEQVRLQATSITDAFVGYSM